MGTIALTVKIATRQRTSYPQFFKAQIVQEFLQLASRATGALRHGIKANLVIKWGPTYRYHQTPALPAFGPMKVEPATPSGQQIYVSIEIPFGQQKLKVNRPSELTFGPTAPCIFRFPISWFTTSARAAQANMHVITLAKEWQTSLR